VDSNMMRYASWFGSRGRSFAMPPVWQDAHSGQALEARKNFKLTHYPGVPGFRGSRVSGFRFGLGFGSEAGSVNNLGTRILRTPELRNSGTSEPTGLFRFAALHTSQRYR
jgi:hypothetical protein